MAKVRRNIDAALQRVREARQLLNDAIQRINHDLATATELFFTGHYDAAQSAFSRLDYPPSRFRFQKALFSAAAAYSQYLVDAGRDKRLRWRAAALVNECRGSDGHTHEQPLEPGPALSSVLANPGFQGRCSRRTGNNFHRDSSSSITARFDHRTTIIRDSRWCVEISTAHLQVAAARRRASGRRVRDRVQSKRHAGTVTTRPVVDDVGLRAAHT
jgi:hypothetical protein